MSPQASAEKQNPPCEAGSEVAQAGCLRAEKVYAWPRHGTMQRAVLGSLARAQRPMCHLDIQGRHGTYRMAACVHQLRRKGFLVVAELVEVETRYGQRARCAWYRMPPAEQVAVLEAARQAEVKL